MMKTNKIITVFISILFVLTIVSCSKDETSKNRDYLDSVTGTYVGEFTSVQKTTETIATADVTRPNNDQLQIHCYGETIDTTIIMDAFQNGDSVMLCNTGDDFYNEYGHMSSGSHMMGGMGTDQTDWMYHMQNEHHAGDKHYGSFDMKNHTFHYSFKMMENDSLYMLGFDGIKH